MAVAPIVKYNLFIDELSKAGHNLATAGGIGPFRYVIIYNSSATNKVVASIDNGASVTLADTDTFTTDFDGTNGVLTVQ